MFDRQVKGVVEIAVCRNIYRLNRNILYFYSLSLFILFNLKYTIVYCKFILF